MAATPTYLTSRASQTSRYKKTKIHLDNFVSPGRRRYGQWRRFEISLENSTKYVVTTSDIGRIDLIAWKNLGDSSLWWAIADINRIKNPFEDLSVGQVLTIPNPSELSLAMGVSE